MMINDEEIKRTLNSNPSFTGYGRAGEEKLTDSEKVVISRTIIKSLAIAEKDLGTDFQVALWANIQRNLATTNWLARCGCWAVWKRMYKDASATAQREVLKGKSFGDELLTMAKATK
jgi:hypothetical protein